MLYIPLLQNVFLWKEKVYEVIMYNFKLYNLHISLEIALAGYKPNPSQDYILPYFRGLGPE